MLFIVNSILHTSILISYENIIYKISYSKSEHSFAKDHANLWISLKFIIIVKEMEGIRTVSIKYSSPATSWSLITNVTVSVSIHLSRCFSLVFFHFYLLTFHFSISSLLNASAYLQYFFCSHFVLVLIDYC